MDHAERILDVLMKKYTLHKQEIWMQITNYKTHARHFRVAIGGIFIIMSFILSKQFDDMVSYASMNRSYVLIIIMFGITTTIYYFIYDVIESQCAIMLLSARMSMLEKTINKTVGEPLLNWEAIFSPRFWSFGGLPGASNPSVYAVFYQAILIIAASIILPAYFYARLWFESNSEDYVLRTFLVLATTYSICSAIVCIYVGTYVMTKLRDRAREIMYALLEEQLKRPSP